MAVSSLIRNGDIKQFVEYKLSACHCGPSATACRGGGGGGAGWLRSRATYQQHCVASYDAKTAAAAALQIFAPCLVPFAL